MTLLFTDIEGSTRLLAELRSGYVEVLSDYRRILRSSATDHAGVEVDTQGDSLLLAFARPSDAVAAASDAQLVFGDGPVRVRMGVHTGELELTDEGYVGIDLHRASRIADAGHGGQVLLSSATRALVDEPTVDLGSHWLRHLDEPESIFQLCIEGQREAFPPLRTAEADRPALPAHSTSFVGRERELTVIGELLDDPDRRIVSLVGPGGCGKTRLALEATAAYWERRRQRAVFVPLVTLSDPDLLVAVLAEALGLAIDIVHGIGRSMEGQLLDYLRPRALLLVLDNLEQLLPAATDLLACIVEGAPEVKLLITSRSRLGLQAEWAVEVAGLGTHAVGRDAGMTGATGTTDPAIRLFLERARQHEPGLSVSDDVWSDIGRICSLVEGMPLGIELAAAWAAVLPPRELADELERSFDVLATEAADLPQRHRSIRATFDGSMRLLDEEQRRALAAASVFRGPFTREAATQVAGISLPTLAQLVARSLVRRGEDDRYEIHELIHQYAAELAEARGEAKPVRQAHARFFADLVVEHEPRFRSPEAIAARVELRPDLADIRAASEWAVTQWTIDAVQPLLRTLSVMWSSHIDPKGVEVFRAIARQVGARDTGLDVEAVAPMTTLVAAHLALSLASVDADTESDEVASASIAQLRNAGMRWEVAACLLAMGMNRVNRDENEAALPYLVEADEVMRELGDELMQVDCLTWLGWARLVSGDAAGARIAYEKAHRLALDIGDPVALAFAVSKIGTLDDAEGRPEAALARHLDAFAGFDAAGNAGGVGFSLSRASLSAFALGDHQSALDFALAAYEGFSDVGHGWGRAIAAARMSYAYLGLGRVGEGREWGLTALRLAPSGLRLGRLYALSAVAAAMIRAGDTATGLPILRATVADPEFPPVFSVQARAELARAEAELPAAPSTRPESTEAPDLDGLVDRLLGEAGSSLPR